MKKRLFAFICLIATSAVAGDSVVMRVGNVLGDPEEGGEPHHMVRTQRYFAKLVWEKTGGEVELRFLEAKSLPTFQMLGMVTKGEVEATNVPGFFLSKVPELGVQTIPYLFEGLEHARRFPRSQAADYLAAKIENAYGVHVVSFMQIASSASIMRSSRFGCRGISKARRSLTFGSSTGRCTTATLQRICARWATGSRSREVW